MSFESRSINHNEKSVMAGIERCNNFHDLIVWIYPYVEQEHSLLASFEKKFPNQDIGQTFTEKILFKTIHKMIELNPVYSRDSAFTALLEALEQYHYIRNN
jgi:hypothetical protein